MHEQRLEPHEANPAPHEPTGQELRRPWPEVAAFTVDLAVTTRHGGISEGPYNSLNLGLHVGDDPDRVIVNRRRAAAAFGMDLATTVFADQVHGVSVAVVGRAEWGRGALDQADAMAATDILITGEPGTTLVIQVADCLPVALVDPEARLLAVVHAGWRGTAAGAVGRAVETMIGLGGRADRLVAFLGPAVQPERYQVDEAVRTGLAAAVTPDELSAGIASPDGPDHWRVDLAAANRQQLERAGLSPEHVLRSEWSTADDDFYSDRAARPCGRFALLARLLP